MPHMNNKTNKKVQKRKNNLQARLIQEVLFNEIILLTEMLCVYMCVCACVCVRVRVCVCVCVCMRVRGVHMVDSCTCECIYSKMAPQMASPFVPVDFHARNDPVTDSVKVNPAKI